MEKKEKHSGNYMDYIPIRNPEYGWKVKENGKVEVAVINKGVFNKIAQVVFRRPRISYIELDENGSYLWQQMDGKTTVAVLADKMAAQFHEEKNMALNRLVTFLKTLQTNHYISYADREEREDA